MFTTTFEIDLQTYMFFFLFIRIHDTLMRIERVTFERNANTGNESFIVKTIIS